MAGKSLRFGGVFGGGTGSGIKKVVDATARLALTPAEGDFVIQLDTDELWYYDGTQWKRYGDTDSIIYGADTNSVDLTINTTTNTLTAAVKRSAAGADASNQAVQLLEETDGLRAQILDSLIRGLFSATAPVALSVGGVISMAASSDSVDGYLTAADHTKYEASYALRHVAMTLAAFGSTPNANGLSVSGTDSQTLNMQPADASNPGGVSTAAQSFAGEKRFPAGVNAGSGSLGADMIFQAASTSKGSFPWPVMSNAQMLAIAGPTQGLVVFNSTENLPYIFNGLLWESLGIPMLPTAVTYTSGALALDRYTNQVLRIAANSGAVAISSITHATMAERSIVTFLGTSDANPVVIDTVTGISTNGTCVLGNGDVLQCMKIGSTLQELYRNA